MSTRIIYEPSKSNRTRNKYNSNTSRRSKYQDAEGSTVIRQRFHKSISIESSKAWYRREIAYQSQRGGLFEDPFMPAFASSIGPNVSDNEYTWLRPRELTRTAKFESDGFSRFDVKQGELGNCWVIAALTSLSIYPQNFYQVVPRGQTFDASPSSDSAFPYVGMFWFRFWRFGQWEDIVIDDRLPTRNGHLVFMHSSDPNEFWSALLEKAYAKLTCNYAALRGGTTTEAMEDFTGGLTEYIDLNEKIPPDLFQVMKQATNRSSLMACSIDAPPGRQETEGPSGLILGHAYAVTKVHEVTSSKTGKVQLLRLRNPWGNSQEWRGAWSDKSREWINIQPWERQKIELTFENDGEFWISFADFVHFFSRLECCHLGPESVALSERGKMSTKRRWEMTTEEGEWLRNSTAGGCLNFPETFHMNPQFMVNVIDPDETDDEDYGTIVVGLMQKSMRQRHQDPHVIGYAIYKLPDNAMKGCLLNRAFFRKNTSVARSPVFINMREVCGRHKLKPGKYVIVPSTFNPNDEAKFLLRIFSERACSSSELDELTQISDPSTPVLQIQSPDVTFMEKLEVAFNKIAGPKGAIHSSELLDILNGAFQKDFPFDGFSKETARSMVALMDVDLSGSLEFPEFQKLWMEIRLWKTIFKKFDYDHSGNLNAFELRSALKSVGIRVSNNIWKAINCRYANCDDKVSFDDFILLLVRLVTVFETYKTREHLEDGRAIFEPDDFIRSVIYI